MQTVENSTAVFLPIRNRVQHNACRHSTKIAILQHKITRDTVHLITSKRAHNQQFYNTRNILTINE